MRLHGLFVSLLLTGLLTMGCESLSVEQKPPTPAETQLIVQVVAKHALVKHLSDDQTHYVLHSIAALRSELLASAAAEPATIMDSIEQAVGEEYADVAALIVVLVKERVHFATLPPREQSPYVLAVLNGLEGALKHAH